MRGTGSFPVKECRREPEAPIALQDRFGFSKCAPKARVDRSVENRRAGSSYPSFCPKRFKPSCRPLQQDLFFGGSEWEPKSASNNSSSQRGPPVYCTNGLGLVSASTDASTSSMISRRLRWSFIFAKALTSRNNNTSSVMGVSSRPAYDWTLKLSNRR